LKSRSRTMSQPRAKKLSEEERRRLLMCDLHVAFAAAPIPTWDAAETELVLDVVQQIVRRRSADVVLFPVAETQR